MREQQGQMRMRFVCLSDTHGLHDQIVVPDGDVLLHGDDLAAHGRLAELRAFNTWLGHLPHQHKIIIAGNHDFACEQHADTMEAILGHAIYLCDRATSCWPDDLWCSLDTW